MEVITRNPVWTDSDYYLYADARRRRPKRRYGLNKAVGYIPAVAIARAVKDRRDENRRLERVEAVQQRRRAEGRPAPKRRTPPPSRRRRTRTTGGFTPQSGKPSSQSTRPPRPENRPSRPPRPEGKPNTSGQVLDKPSETTQSFLKNKALMIGIGVLVVGIIGYFIFKSSKGGNK